MAATAGRLLPYWRRDRGNIWRSLYGDQHTGKNNFRIKNGKHFGQLQPQGSGRHFFSTSYTLNPEYYRARLAGKRMVVASETQSGMGLADALVKELTGNEGNISGRHPAGRPFEFEMQGKLVLASNKEPQLRGSPEGMPAPASCRAVQTQAGQDRRRIQGSVEFPNIRGS